MAKKKVAVLRIRTYDRRLSPLAFATLEAIANGRRIKLADMSAATLGPLIKRGFVSNDGNMVAITSTGLDARDFYLSGEPPMRMHPAELTDYVAMLLGMGKRGKKGSAG